VAAIKAEVDIPVAASLGMLTQAQVDDLHDMGVHRYNHNPEAARSYFPQVVTTHSYQERWDTCPMIKESGMELCCDGPVAMGETIEQRAERAAQLGELELPEVPLNFLSRAPAPRSATWRSCLQMTRCGPSPRSVWPCRARSCATKGGHELTLGDLGTRDGLLGGINAASEPRPGRATV